MREGGTPSTAATGLSEETRFLLDALCGGVVIQDGRGFTTYANQAALDLLGLSFDQIRGIEPFPEGWGAYDDQGAPLGLEDQPAMVALRTGQPARFVVTVIAPGCDRRFVWAQAVPVLDQAGRPGSVISSFVDLSERLVVEERLQLALDAAPARLGRGPARDLGLGPVERQDRLERAGGAALRD